MIDIPDFTAVSDDDLHGWEFRIYEAVPGDADLAEIIGIEKAREYYNERGSRLDRCRVKELNVEIDRLIDSRDEALHRLRTGKSGQHYFSGQAEVWGKGDS